jgi:hypothetical protein
MKIPRILACLSVAAAPLVGAQTAPPTNYTITEALSSAAPGATETIYRSGDKVLTDVRQPSQGAAPASRTMTLYDLKAGTTIAWNAAVNPPVCGGSGTFSGDWGDPLAMTTELNEGISGGALKPAGTETIAGIPTVIYQGSDAQSITKAWLDKKDGIVIRAVVSAPGIAPMTVVDITKVSLDEPAASLFIVPAACAGSKPPPAPSQLIAQETDDDPANYVNGLYGPGSQKSCSVVLRVVNARTMTPIAHVQVAIDTSYKQDDPPHYTSGMHDDGTVSYSGGAIHEITSQVHNGVVSLGNLPSYFMLDVNLIHPGHGDNMALIYRQCFAPTTVLLYVVKDYGEASEGGDFLWVKAGKYAAAPAH